jgi:hypothetical protein
MNYKTLKAQYKANKELLKHYKEMSSAGISELHFEKLQNDYLLSVLSKVEELANKNVNPELIKQVIENAKQRHYLDKLIHADLIFKN